MYIYLYNYYEPIKLTIMKTLAIINTKSNFRNLNGTVQQVIEIVGTRVSCKIWSDENQKYITCDFGICEVTLN